MTHQEDHDTMSRHDIPTPSIERIRDILHGATVWARYDSEADGLVYDGQILHPADIRAAWDRIPPDDNDHLIMDPEEQVVFGATMGHLPELWLDHPTNQGDHDSHGL